MPFSTLHYPSLGLSLLKPALQKIGATCNIRYFFLDYADQVGLDTYHVIEDPRCYQALLGEWVFAGAANDESKVEDWLEYFSDVFAPHYSELHTIERVLLAFNARYRVKEFIERCADEVGDGFDLVGFTTSYQQTSASLALGRAIKRNSPNTRIVFGGANCRGEMGLALLRCYPFIDAVCLDEGDHVFPEYLRRIVAGEPGSGVAGMAVRHNGLVCEQTVLSTPVHDLDALPDPDFSDFFEQHAGSKASLLTRPAVLVETSRGCWWGAKHHCTFCGINGVSMAFRSKSQERAYHEITRLAEAYGRDFVSVDAILDHRSFTGFLERLATGGPAITMYVEVKANLRPEQIVTLARSGARKVQPGIESLDTELLTLMRKGCTMLQNVQTLKIAAESGVYVEWNLLHGFPGEGQPSYERMTLLIPLLYHLQPPNAVGAVRADRFSPYFERTNYDDVVLEPLPAYRHIFPFDIGEVNNLAYHFLIRKPRMDGPAVKAMTTSARLWKEHHGVSELTVRTVADGCVVRDCRWGRDKQEYQLYGCAAAIYSAAWQITSWRALCSALNGSFENSEIESEIDSLASKGLILRERGNILALALRQPGYKRAPSWSEIRANAEEPYMLSGAAKEPAVYWA
jgi:ribosomal peptide maturation radical SAM protein 1